MNKNLENIMKANSSRYNDNHQVDDYLFTPYHYRRIILATKLLDNELSALYCDYNKSDLRILELASSTGTVGKLISDMGYSIIVSDCEEEPLGVAADKGLKTIKFDVTEKFPFEDKTFHAIFAGELIEHVFDTEFFLSECHRVLVDGGVFVLTTPNLAIIQDRIRFIFGFSPRQINPLHEYYSLHIRPFTFSLIKSTLFKKKFMTRRLLSNYVTLKIGNKKIIESKLLATLLPSLGGSLIVSAVKM